MWCTVHLGLCMETAVTAQNSLIFSFQHAGLLHDETDKRHRAHSPSCMGSSSAGMRTQTASSETGPASVAVLAAVVNTVFEWALPAQVALLLLQGVRCDCLLTAPFFQGYPFAAPPDTLSKGCRREL